MAKPALNHLIKRLKAMQGEANAILPGANATARRFRYIARALQDTADIADSLEANTCLEDLPRSDRFISTLSDVERQLTELIENIECSSSSEGSSSSSSGV